MGELDGVGLLAQTTSWMRDRGWHTVLAKERGFRQTLFDHTLRHVDVWLSLYPLLSPRNSARLTETDLRLLLAGSVLHDAGKEKVEFRAYLEGGPWASHTLPADFRHRLDEVCELFAVEDRQSVFAIARLSSVHDLGGVASLQEAITPHTSSEWASLRDLLNAVDQLVSAHSLSDSLRTLRRTALGRFLAGSIHRVQFRGVLSAYLHEACEKAHKAAGWLPVLHFAEGTLYAAELAAEPVPPDRASIHETLVQLLEPEIRERVAPEMMVGSPITDALPKPELFDWRMVHSALQVAYTRVRPANYLKKNEEDRLKRAAEVLKRRGEPASKQALATTNRVIAEAQPEIMVLRVFKSALELLPHPSRRAVEDALDKRFHWPFSTALRSQSTLSPARDVADRILPLWETAGAAFGLPHGLLGDADWTARRDVLIRVLADEYIKVAEGVAGAPAGLDQKAVADIALSDLLEPASQSGISVSVVAAGEQQLAAYGRSKQSLFKKGGSHTCPICNADFTSGQPAREAFLPKPKTFTNRATAMLPLNNVVICKHCRMEAVFRQLMLGSTTTGGGQPILILFPKLNVGHSEGVDALGRVEKMRQAFTHALDSGIRFDNFAVREGNARTALALPHAPTEEELARLYTYGAGKPPSRKTLIGQVRKNIEQQYLTLEDFSEVFGQEFETLEDAATAVLAGQLQDENAIMLLPSDVQPSRPPVVICRTANMALVPLRGPVGLKNDSDADAAIRTVFVSISFGLAFNATAMIVPASEPVPGHGGEGIAWVPPVPAARTLFGDEWIPEHAALTWLRAIAAAAQLGDIYPERSSLLRTLSATSPGEIVRRYEQSGITKIGRPFTTTMEQIELIELIRPVLKPRPLANTGAMIAPAESGE